MTKLKNLLISLLTNLMIVSFVVLCAEIIIGALIFGQKSVILSNFYIQVPILFVVSILLTLFYQINRMTQTIQVLTTYVTILLLIYLFGFFTGWFAFDNLKFVIISLSLNAVGLTITIIALLLKRKKQNELLNRQLSNIKERAYNEED